MNLTLMYHQIHNPELDYGVKEFTKHLEYLVKNFQIVTPFRDPNSYATGKAFGNLVDKNLINKDKKKVSVCLTFDDAYFDFYHYVFPMLKKLNIQAVLAIPTAFIRTRSTLDADKRLSISYPAGLERDNLQYNTPLCTWNELQEMVDSGHVVPASHSHTHCNLILPKVDLEKEIVHSKEILEAKLNCLVNCFVYPFGKWNKRVHKIVQKHYDYAFRIGSAMNKDWNNKSKLFYRVDAEHIWPKNKPLTKGLLRKFKFKYFLNKIRFK